MVHFAPMSDYLPAYQELTDVVNRLLSPEGCPWDREQTHESLKHYLIEEAYELVEAIEENDDKKMEEELGDLLFHVVIHSAIAEKNKRFDLKTVTNRITEKMIRRHPHVFGDHKVNSVEDVWRNWDHIKRLEKKDKNETALTAVPRNLPALLRAEKIQKRAARSGFDWDHLAPVWDKLDEEIGELKQAIDTKDQALVRNELGDILFSVVNLARKLEVDPEEALHYANQKFIKRFSSVEDTIQTAGKTLAETSAEEIDRLWQTAKLQEK